MATTYKQNIDLNEVFSFLRDRYLKKTGSTSVSLAKTIEERPQCVSSWSTGYKSRKPPLRLIIWLASESGTELRIGPNGITAHDEAGDQIMSFDLQ